MKVLYPARIAVLLQDRSDRRPPSTFRVYSVLYVAILWVGLSSSCVPVPLFFFIGERIFPPLLFALFVRDADYRHPLAGQNAGRYVTLQKDLGGFNNIRLSLETGVAFAAATGRTFVIPPPFTIWNMNGQVEKKVGSLHMSRSISLRVSFHSTIRNHH